MALSKEELENFGSGLSATKKGKLVNQLSIRDVEKELEYWKKQVDFYDKEFAKYPAFSEESNNVINQRDEAIKGALTTSVFLLNKAQTYKNPVKGPVSPDSPVNKDLVIVNKYKGFDLNNALELSRTFSAGMTGRGGAQNPLTQQLLPSIKKGNIFVTAPATSKAGPTGPGFRAREGFTPGPTGATGATGPTVGGGATGPTVTGGKTTTGGKTKTGTTVVVDGKKVKVGGDKWKEIIQEEFGSLWDIYNDNADVKKVIDKSVAEGWFNDETKIDASLKNTNWYRATQSSVRAYTIQKSTDPATLEASINQAVADLRDDSLASGVVLSDTTLRTLAENKVKYKWSEQQVANAIGSETVATARLGGPQAVADLRKGSVGTSLREIADNYAQKPTDTMLDMWVAEVMQGTKTQEQFTDLMKTQASTQYRSLAPLIEKGQDVKTAVSMYTNAAQNVLGVDPNTVDWSQDKWNKALNYQDPKTSEYRQMDSWEWNRYLRSLPEWQETDDAKQTYRRAAFTLAQAFGKTS